MNVGIDIKDIPKIADKEFSVTLNAFFVVILYSVMRVKLLILHLYRCAGRMKGLL